MPTSLHTVGFGATFDRLTQLDCPSLSAHFLIARSLFKGFVSRLLGNIHYICTDKQN